MRPSLTPADVASLSLLADGSIGRALELAEEGGVKLFRQLMELLSGLPQLNITRLHKLCEQAARGDALAH